MRELLDKRITKQAMQEELNSIAGKATTQVRRHLAHQTQLPYGYMMNAVTLKRASANFLVAEIKVSDKATSLARYMTSYTKRPRSWRKKGWVQRMNLRVWSGSQLFPKSSSARPFVIEGGARSSFGWSGQVPNLIAVRVGGAGSRKIKVLSGPNLAGGKQNTGEVSRLETKTYITVQLPQEFNESIERRIDRIIAAAPTK